MMSENGADIKLMSLTARKLFPYNVETKNRKDFKTIYKHYRQTKGHGPFEPLLIIKSNKEKPLAIIDMEHLFDLLEDWWKNQILLVTIDHQENINIQRIEKNKRTYKNKYNLNLRIIGISGKNKKKKRPFNSLKYIWYKNPIDMINNKEINLIVELVGGSSGVALELAKKSLRSKKSFVTANKAMIAVHGKYLCNSGKPLVNMHIRLT